MLELTFVKDLQNFCKIVYLVIKKCYMTNKTTTECHNRNWVYRTFDLMLNEMSHSNTSVSKLFKLAKHIDGGRGGLACSEHACGKPQILFVFCTRLHKELMKLCEMVLSWRQERIRAWQRRHFCKTQPLTRAIH